MEELLHERLAALSLEQKVRLLTGADFWGLHEEPAAGLRRIVTSDGPAGVRGERWDELDPSANVPSPTALAATWDEARVERMGRLLASEARRKGVDVLLAPTVNLHRTPYGGRHFECFSEDPLLTARIGAAYVHGLQDEGVAATVKHFVANDSETERFTYDAVVDERVLRELYMVPFAAVRPWAFMSAYNAVNGHLMSESPLLREVLKDEWGNDALVMSDWGATRHTVESATAALDLAMPGPDGPWGDALVQAVRAGRVSEAAIDDKVLRLLRLAARVGKLDGVAGKTARAWSEQEIAAELRATAAASFVLARNHGALLPLSGESLRRVAVIGPGGAFARTLGGGSATVFPRYTVSPLDGLRAALPNAEVTYSPGVFAHTRLPRADLDWQVRYLDIDGGEVDEERRRLGELMVMEPLEGVRAIEFRGALTAEVSGEHLIGVSGVGRFTLEVDEEIRFEVELALREDADDPGAAIFSPPQHAVPVALEAGQSVEIVVGREYTGAQTFFQVNVEPPHDADAEFERALALARDADVAVVVVGTTPEVESEGFDRASLALPGRQDELVRAVNEVQPRTIAVVNAGAPVLMPWLSAVPATLLVWFPGQEAGHALADVLLGAAEPGGRLPTTWPASEQHLPSVTPVDGVLSYREGLGVGYRSTARGAPLLPFGHGLGYTPWEYLGIQARGDCARVTVVNAGTRRGREVVQVYAARPESAVARPPLWLVGFASVEAAPGEEVTVDVPLASLAHWQDGGWTTEPGAFELTAGRSLADLRVHTTITV